LREEHKLTVFENGVLRKIYGSNRHERTGEWRRLHNEELSALHSSLNIIRVVKSGIMRWAGHVARMGDRSGENRVLVVRLQEKRPLEKPRRRWERTIKMDP
jgi:hypothetical protein